jgi:hypothetical protein
MPLYYFILKSKLDRVADEEGVELPDVEAARDHAIGVARELMRNADIVQRFARIEVCDDYLMPLFDFVFAEVDPRIDHLEPRYREVLERVSRGTASLHDAMMQARASLAQVRETFAQVERFMDAAAGSGRQQHKSGESA